jgi:hypothetical protein
VTLSTVNVTQRVFAHWLRRCCVLALVSLAFVAGSRAHADPIVVPPSLSPGDHYQLMFVTSLGRDATSSNIDDYNLFVTTQAAALTALLLPQPVSWHAIGSTSTVNARDNAPQLDSVYDLQGNRITTLDATHGLYHTSANLLERAPDVDETGTLVGAFGRWTGTQDPSGLALGGSALGQQFPWVGYDDQTGTEYISSSSGDARNARGFYALSSDLVVPSSAVPEPTGVMMLVMGTVALLAYRRLSNRHRSSEAPGHRGSLPTH